MDSLLQDCRYALRTLRRSPAFTVTALLTLGLAVGANAALFAVVNAVLVAPLPYAEPGELTVVWSALTARNVDRFPISFPMLQEIERSDAFERVAGLVTQPMGLAQESREPERLDVAWVSHDFFALLDVRPALGRDFSAEDAAPGGPQVQLVNQSIAVPQVALLTHAAWRDRFGADATVLGTSVLIEGLAVRLVGVLPEGFALHMPPQADIAAAPELYVPLRPDFATAPMANVLLTVVGRLRDRTGLDALRVRLRAAGDEILARSDVLARAGFELRAEALASDLTAESRTALLALLGAVGLVLLIACANISTLLLVRSAARAREIAVRAALGVRRARLVRQLATESVVLGVAGGGLGVLLAALALGPLTTLVPRGVPRAAEATIDPAVLGFSLFAALAATLVFGLVPVVRASRPELMAALKSRGIASDRSQGRTRAAAVMVQVMLSTVLLIIVGLTLRGVVSLTRVDPGFEPEGALSFIVDVPATLYPRAEERHGELLELQDRLGAIAGVEAVSGAATLPLRDGVFWGPYGLEDALSDSSLFRQASYRLVLPGYLRAAGARLIAGRDLNRDDFIEARPRALVDENLAARLWPGELAVGKRIWVRPATPQPVPVEVVGVVAHEHLVTLAEPGADNLYLPGSFVGLDVADRWIVRAPGMEAAALLARVRRVVREFDPLLPVADVRPMDEIVRESLSGPRVALTLLSLFGALAVGITALGLYGVIAYTVRERAHEMGIRMALGARSADIRRLVVGEGSRLAVGGLSAGLAVALSLSRSIAAFVPGNAAFDGATYLAVGLLFLAVAMAAAWIPAARATRVDLVGTLRGS